MDGGGVVVRGDGDDTGAVVARLSYIVEVRDVGVSRVPTPDQNHVGVKPVIRRIRENGLPQGDRHSLMIVADFPVYAGKGTAEGLEEGVYPCAFASLAVHTGSTTLDDSFRAIRGEDVKQGVGNLRESLIPA